MNIEQILNSPKTPLVVIVGGFFHKDRKVAMGFVYKVLSPTKRLIVTCRHVFSGHPNAYMLERGKTHLKPTSMVLSPADTKIDLSFLVADDETKTPCQFFRPTTEREDFANMTLYNSQAQVEDFPGMTTSFKLFEQHITEESTPEDFLDYQVPEGETQSLVKASILKMKSIPGCSGSPIFDKDFNLYGVNVGGKTENNQLVYTPTILLEESFKELQHKIQSFV